MIFFHKPPHPGALAVAMLAILLPAPAQAQTQTWPTRPVRLVVPYVPGGATDLVSRIVAEQLIPKLGQQVVVYNRPGAGEDAESDCLQTEQRSDSHPQGPRGERPLAKCRF